MGDSALRVCFGAVRSAATTRRVQAFAQAMQARPLPGVRDVVPAYTTVTLHYEPQRIPAEEWDARSSYARLAEAVRAALARPQAGGRAKPRTVEVPVCYGGACGPDLLEVAERCGLKPDEVVRRHLASPHRVCMLGFAPGFPFITGLDAALSLPRRATPRTQVLAGSVAIAGEQTCIYPTHSPGGWHVLGRTPLRLFDANATPPSRLRPGDTLRFVPIDEAVFERLWASERQAVHASAPSS